MFSCNNLMSSYSESCDFSDGESIGDSFVGHMSPASSMGNWSPAGCNDQWSDLEPDLSGLITDAITIGQNNKINFNQCNSNNTNNNSNAGYEISSFNAFLTNTNTNNLYRTQQPMFAQPPQAPQQPSDTTNTSSIFNNEFTNELDHYLDAGAASNSMGNVEDLKNLNIEELLHQNSMDFTTLTFPTTNNATAPQPTAQQPIQQQDSPAADIFQISQSTMNSRSHQELLLQLIKQQQVIDNMSNQSSPPPTPSSDWSDIPSPLSSAGDFYDTSCRQKELAVSIKVEDVATLKTTKTSKQPKRKRSNRKQYSTNTGKPRLYKFLKEILNEPEKYSCIEWVDKSTGTFKFLDSSEVARLWGFRKNKPAMKYENFARSLRTYIAKGILKKPRNKLVYCFAQPDTE